MPLMTRIPSDLARFGLKVELAAGWATRGSSSFAPAGVTCHWTAGPRGTRSRPSLNVVLNGRPGLPGPLANIYLARDGTCIVVAAGRANHAGVGGFRGLVGNSAVYGIEAESGGDGDWTPEMRAAYPRLVAALLWGLGRDASWAHGHHEWAPTRKIDIRDIMPQVRAEAAVILRNPAAAADELEEIMGWYKDRADFEEAMSRTVLNRTPSDRDGAWLWDRVVGTDVKTGYLDGQVRGPLMEFEGRSLVQGIRWAVLEVALPTILSAIKSDTDAPEVVAAVTEALKSSEERTRTLVLEAIRAGQEAEADVTAEQILESLGERLAPTRDPV